MTENTFGLQLLDRIERKGQLPGLVQALVKFDTARAAELRSFDAYAAYWAEQHVRACLRAGQPGIAALRQRYSL